MVRENDSKRMSMIQFVFVYQLRRECPQSLPCPGTRDTFLESMSPRRDLGLGETGFLYTHRLSN